MALIYTAEAPFGADTERVERSATVFDYNSPYTLMLWTMRTVDLDIYGHVFGIAPAFGYSGDLDFLGFDVDGTTYRGSGVVGGTGFVTNGASTTNVWTHIAMVRESATSLKIYVDGLEVAALASTQNATSRTAAGIISLFSYNGYPLQGKIACLKIWTTALDASQIATDMAVKLPQVGGVWSYLPMDDAGSVANNLLDQSGNSRDFTLTTGSGIVGVDSDYPTIGDGEALEVEEDLFLSRRNRPGRGPYSLGRYFRPSIDAYSESGNDLISGASTLTFVPTALLLGVGTLSGTSAVTFSPTATLGGQVSISGTSTLTLSSTASLLGLAVLNGSSIISLSPAGVLRGGGALAGAPTVTLVGQGVLSGTGRLLGNTSIAFSGQGATTGIGSLSGLGTLTFAATGGLGSLGSSSLIGSTNLVFTNQGVLRASGSLVGSSALTLGPSASLSAQGSLGGATSLSFTPQGSLTGILPGGILGSSSVTFDPVASLQGSGRLFGSTSLALAASANLVQPSGYTIDGSAQARIEASFGVIRIYSNGINKFYTF